MCPQAAAATTVVDSIRIHINNRRYHQHQVASTKILKKRLCVHPTTMFRIAAKNNGLIRSPKMVKYSPVASRSCATVNLPPHHHC